MPVAQAVVRLPKCPRCGFPMYATDRSRRVFKCAECGHSGAGRYDRGLTVRVELPRPRVRGFDQLFARIAEQLDGLPVVGVCRVCGCTDDRACPGGCSWADARHTICSSCEGRG